MKRNKGLGLLTRSLFFKNMLSYLLVGILPMLIMGLFVFSYFTSTLQARSIASVQSAHEKYDKIVSTEMTNIQTTLNSVQDYISYDSIDKLLLNISAPESRERISVILNILLQSGMCVENAIAVNNDGEWIYASRYKKYASDYNLLRTDIIIDRSDVFSEDAVIMPRHHGQNYFNNANSYVVSIVKRFGDETGKYVGSIIVDVNVFYFKNIIQEDIDCGYFAMTDMSNYCIFSDDIWRIDGNIPVDGMALYPLSHNFADEPVRDKCFFIESSINGIWKTFTYVDREALTANVDIVRNIFLLVVLVLKVILLLLSTYYTYRFTAPVNRILNNLQIIKTGNFSVSLKDEKVAEFSQIAHGINDMQQSLKVYINKTYNAQIKQKEAELNALKMQISPHFLHNMLEIINMTAIEQDDYKVSSMIISLASQFEYMLSNDGEYVTLEEEMKIISHYFLFVKMRYDDRIHLAINMPESLKDKRILKFILQPLVENSVIHGYDNAAVQSQAMNININVMLADDGCLIIDVSDNGKGMDRETLEDLRRFIKKDINEDNEKSTHSNSIGLKNVCRRLQFFYGDKFTVEIDSFEQIGTKIHIKFL